MTKKSDTPAIRFKGFTDTWEQRKLGELALFNPKDELPQTFEYVDLESVVGTEMLSHRTEVKASAPSRAQRLAHTGDLFYQTVRPYQKNNYLFEKPDNNYVFSTGYAQMRPYVDGYFLLSLVQSERFAKVVLDNCTGTSYPAINANDLAEIEVAAPSDESEAQKIGTIFRSIDNLITLHQRKYDKLTNVKKSMLEKMFPKNGSNVPEIRFKGFTEAWEQRKFSELYEKVSRKNDLTYGKDDIISVANMYFKEDSYITDESYLLTYNIFELGDIAFEGNKSKNYAHGRFVENTIGNGIVSHVFDVFKPIMKPYDLQFWKYAINNEQLMGGILLRSTKASTMMTNLVANDFLQETFLTPTYPEQQKIGAFFQQLDNLITLHQCEFQIVSKRRKARLRRRAFEFTVIFALIVL